MGILNWLRGKSPEPDEEITVIHETSSNTLWTYPGPLTEEVREAFLLEGYTIVGNGICEGCGHSWDDHPGCCPTLLCCQEG
jgi:hypothetical protein